MRLPAHSASDATIRLLPVRDGNFSGGHGTMPIAADGLFGHVNPLWAGRGMA